MSLFTPSHNVQKMHMSSTMKAAQAAQTLRDQGVDVIDLTLGEPDFDTPQFIKDFAIEGMQKGLTKYTPTPGLKMFRESIADFYKWRFNAWVSPGEIVASGGGKQALFNAACTLLNPGDEVLVPRPYWVTFPEIVTFCGATSVFIETGDTGFALSAERVRESITNKTRLLIINSPNNPSGGVTSADEMRKIVEVCAENGVFVLTDECYLFFVYPPSEVFTSASLPPELRRWVCVAGSFSKTYAMTGWRCGYTIANEDWSREMIKLQSHSSTHPTSFVQYACAKAMQNPQMTMDAVDNMLAEYARRREWLIPALNEVPGFKCQMPQGAFYAFVDVRDALGDLYKRSADVAEALLLGAHTVVTDGAGFGDEGFLRISYATSMENLHNAVAGMKELFTSKATVV